MYLYNTIKWMLIGLLGLMAYGASAQSKAMSLNDCIQFATENNSNIKAAKLQIRDAEWQIKENTAGGLPQISAGLSYTGFIQRGGLPSSALSFGGSGNNPVPQVVYDQFTQDQVGALGAFLGSAFASDPDSKIFFSPVHSVSGNIAANQLIFSNSYLLAKRAARYYRTYVNEQLNTVRYTVRNTVTDAYLPALLMSENVATIDKNIVNLNQTLNEVKEMNKAGFVEQLDVDRLDLAISTLRSERDNLVRQREIVINALKMVMGMPISESITLTDNLEKLMVEYSDADLVTSLDPMKRPEYTALLKARELSALQLELYRKPWMPNVVGFLQYQPGLQGGFGTKGEAGFNKWYFIPSAVGGISITSTLYDGGVSKAKKQRAMIAVENVDEQKKMLLSAFELELENARKQYLNAQARVANQQKNLDLAQRIFTTSQIKYKSGVGSSAELIQAEQALTNAQQSLSDARHALLTSRVAIKKAMGN